MMMGWVEVDMLLLLLPPLLPLVTCLSIIFSIFPENLNAEKLATATRHRDEMRERERRRKGEFSNFTPD